MPERLSPLDVSFLYMETPSTPMHVGGVAVFQQPEDRFDHQQLVELISDRIGFVPRYRQRIRWVPGHLASPVWVDDEAFDVSYHVRRSALPKPGSDAQLLELVGRIMGRQLDRNRPLWEMYLVEGLSDNRFAILTKTHHAMVDGGAAVDIAQVILDETPDFEHLVPQEWTPEPEPSSSELVSDAVSEILRSPREAVAAARAGIDDLTRTTTAMAGRAVGVLSAVRTMSRPPSDSPLNVEIGEARRFSTLDISLESLKTIRKAHGGTINDVVLAVVAGGLRQWLMTRGEAVTPRSTIRAMVPVSVRASHETAMGNRVASFLVDLPVGEPDPIIRLQRVSHEMTGHKETGQMVAAEALVEFAGFSPPTLHALGARLGSDLSRRIFNLVVTNVPGPQIPLYAGGSLMLAAYPVVPLAKGQALSIGLTSYNGGVFFGLNADRDGLPDVDVVADCLAASLEEILETTRPKRRPRPARRSARPKDAG